MPRASITIALFVWSCEQPKALTYDSVSKIAPLIDPDKLSTLTGKRAATPRLRKACHWLEVARRNGHSLVEVISEAHVTTGHGTGTREAEQSASLIRNVTILERLGCLDIEGMEKLRRGKAPTIMRGPYTGQLATVDHIIPRSIAPELDNALFNLEFMPEKVNQSKSNKVTKRQAQLAKKWHGLGLLSSEGLRSVTQAYLALHPR